MLTIGYCTRESDIKHTEHLIKMSGLGSKKVQIIEIVNNGDRSLTECYNEILQKSIYNHIVFCHNDITVETKNFGTKLLKLFNKHKEYSIIGVAGSKYLPSSGTWWEHKKKMYGRVAHTHEGKSWLSSYSSDMGHDIEEVVIVDGVFFAIDKTKIKTGFNETVEGFHFYDVTFCLENYLKGTKIGVITAIRINHKSIGMTNESWEANRLIFAETFKENLPINIKKVLRKGEKLKVLIGCLNFRGDTPEEKYILDLVKELIKQDCDVSLASNIDKKLGGVLKQLGVKMFTLQEPPGFKLGDGKWSLNSTTGPILSQPNTLYKVSETSFDVLHINQKPVADHLLRLFPDTETICTIHTTDRSLDEPVISPQVKKYIAINDEIKEVLIDGYGIDSSLIEDANKEKIIEEYKLMLS